MKKTLFSFIALLSITNGVSAQKVWSTDVAPILYNKCASCHHSGGIAPFALLTYQDAVNNAGTIAQQVSDRKMPPWPPDPSFNRMAHERLLSVTEINTIKDWVAGGNTQGNISLAPPQPTFNNAGDLPGTPDLVSKMPQFTSTASTGDIYQCFVIPSGLAADKYITALEAIPGNRSIVHHVQIFADTTGICAGLDAASPGPGYLNFGGVGTNDATLLGVWVPGSGPIKYPNGFGVRIPKNADIVLQVHYPAGTSGQLDQTEIHFFFTSTPGLRMLSIDPILNHLTNVTPALVIPANQTKTFTEHFKVPFVNITMVGLFPHMHLLGKTINCFGITPNKDTQKYISIPDWDFHWQGFYMFRNMVKVPGNTDLYSNALYDNTTNNSNNPNSPPKEVKAGDATTDEMMLTYFIYTPYQTGDENIVIDNTPLADLGVEGNLYKSDILFALGPNPTTGNLVLKYYLAETAAVSIDVTDVQGRVVQQLLTNTKMPQGYTANVYSVAELAAGMYNVRLHTSGKTLTEKLLIQH